MWRFEHSIPGKPYMGGRMKTEGLGMYGSSMVKQGDNRKSFAITRHDFKTSRGWSRGAAQGEASHRRS